jgi:hypothetical protein
MEGTINKFWNDVNVRCVICTSSKTHADSRSLWGRGGIGRHSGRDVVGLVISFQVDIQYPMGRGRNHQ